MAPPAAGLGDRSESEARRTARHRIQFPSRLLGGDSLVEWRVLTLGCLSRNKFWGEDPGRAYRQARCTSVLLKAAGKTILCDPSLPGEAMARTLDERCGISIERVGCVYLSHFHGDHRVDLTFYADVPIFMPAAEIAYWQGRLAGNALERSLLARIQPAPDELAPGVQLLPCPGHTPGVGALRFDAAEGCVVFAADAVMTRDFFRAREGYFNNVDPLATRASIERIAKLADVVIPGHDNYFLSRAAL